MKAVLLLAPAVRSENTGSPILHKPDWDGVLLVLEVESAGTGGLSIDMRTRTWAGPRSFLIPPPKPIRKLGRFGVLYATSADSDLVRVESDGHVHAAYEGVPPARWDVRIEHADGSPWGYSVWAVPVRETSQATTAASTRIGPLNRAGATSDVTHGVFMASLGRAIDNAGHVEASQARFGVSEDGQSNDDSG
jgi:hypothetical protein